MPTIRPLSESKVGQYVILYAVPIVVALYFAYAVSSGGMRRLLLSWAIAATLSVLAALAICDVILDPRLHPDTKDWDVLDCTFGRGCRLRSQQPRLWCSSSPIGVYLTFCE